MSGKFLSQKVMSLYKHEEAVRNSQIKRSEYKRSNHEEVVKCGCDIDGSCHFVVDMTKHYNNPVAIENLKWRQPDENSGNQ